MPPKSAPMGFITRGWARLLVAQNLREHSPTFNAQRIVSLRRQAPQTGAEGWRCYLIALTYRAFLDSE